MKLWVDDVRPAPSGFDAHSTSVMGTIDFIAKFYDQIEVISLDHDSGEFYYIGGDYIKILDWAERQYGSDFKPAIHLHSMNPVGRENMRRIIERNGWTEVK